LTGFQPNIIFGTSGLPTGTWYMSNETVPTFKSTIAVAQENYSAGNYNYASFV